MRKTLHTCIKTRMNYNVVFIRVSDELCVCVWYVRLAKFKSRNNFILSDGIVWRFVQIDLMRLITMNLFGSTYAWVYLCSGRLQTKPNSKQSNANEQPFDKIINAENMFLFEIKFITFFLFSLSMEQMLNYPFVSIHS